MPVMLTVDWFPLGRDVYFRKFELYSLNFQHEANIKNLVVAAPYGGPIAITRDPRKFVKVQGGSKPVISIYSSSGNTTANMQWNSGLLVNLGWSNKEELLCIQDDGSVSIYDMFGNFQHCFSMGNEAKETKVVEAKFFTSVSGTGVGVLTSANRIFVVNNIANPKVRQISEIPKLGGPIESWCIVRNERDCRIILSNQDGIHLLDCSYQGSTMIPFDNLFKNKINSVKHITVSGNAKHVALYSDTGSVYLGSIDFKNKYCEHLTNETEPLTDIAWCGTAAVVCCWNSTIMVLGRSGDTILYTYDGPAHLITEIDGVRVLSTYSHEMIQKVPDVVQKIFRINSTDPASYLLEASKQFEKKSHKSDSYIDLITNKLQSAVTDCINAASHEFDHDTQKLLMRAANFGMGFCEMNPEHYVNTIRMLRVLNAVRNPTIGIPLTYTQLTNLTNQVLLDRLVARRHYYLSILISRHLQLPKREGESRILAHWVCYKVKQTQLDKEQIADEIADKLGYAHGVSFSEIAEKAADCGRTQLAIKLIDYEPRAQYQVPFLLKLREYQAALHKAVESGNTDLVYTVILSLRQHMTIGEFQRSIVMNCPLAKALYIKYCQSHHRETLRDIYNQHDDYFSQALWFIKESYQIQNKISKDSLLQSAQDNFKLARSDTNVTLTEEQIKLLKYQRSLENTLHETVVGKSLNETVKLLLLQNEIKLADKLRSEYKIPDRRYWWLRIQCLAENEMWSDLEKFSKSKKSPIGYEPFIELCLKHNNVHEAKKYLPKIREDLQEKYAPRLK